MEEAGRQFSGNGQQLPVESGRIRVRGRVLASKVIDGHRRTLREYGSGEHVGELAPLREAPRVVDLTALTDDVRMLVVGGGALQSMLDDRPRVARAMLKSLAERRGAVIEQGTPATLEP